MNTDNLDLAQQYARDNAKRSGIPYMVRSGSNGLTVAPFPSCGGVNGQELICIVLKDGTVLENNG